MCFIPLTHFKRTGPYPSGFKLPPPTPASLFLPCRFHQPRSGSFRVRVWQICQLRNTGRVRALCSFLESDRLRFVTLSSFVRSRTGQSMAASLPCRNLRMPQKRSKKQTYHDPHICLCVFVFVVYTSSRCHALWFSVFVCIKDNVNL